MNTNSMATAATNAAKPQGAVAKAPEKKAMSPSVYVGNMLANYKEAIRQALPSVITPDRFTRIATTVVASNPKLYQAVVESPQTFIGALMTAAQLGIEPNTPLGQGYLLPFFNYNKAKGKKVMEVSFQLGVYGVIDLAYRSGEMKTIFARTVCENDVFDYEEGLHPVLRHKPVRGNRGRPIYYYAVFVTKNGGEYFDVMSYEDALAHAKRYSKSYNANTDTFSGPWQTEFDRMAEKTILLRALKYAPKKSDFTRNLTLDNTVKSGLDSDMSIVANDDVIDAEATVVEGEPRAAETAKAQSAAPSKKEEPKKDGEKDIADLI